MGIYKLKGRRAHRQMEAGAKIGLECYPEEAPFRLLLADAFHYHSHLGKMNGADKLRGCRAGSVARSPVLAARVRR